MELVMALGLLMTMVGLLVQFLLTSAHVSNNLLSSVSIQASAQHGLDLMTQDIQGSDLCLANYTNGATTYHSNNTNSLVLRTPALSSDGSQTTSSEDHIVYSLVATTAGASNGPYTLNRWVIPASGSGRPAVTNQVVATNLTSASFSYVAAQTQTQNALGSLLLFVLLNGAVYAAPVGSVGVQQAIVAGVDQCAGSSTCFSGGSLTLSTAITANLPVDMRFSIDPSITVSLSILAGCGVTCGTNEGANFAKEVIISLRSAGAAGSGNSLSAAAPTTALITTASLRNKTAF